jgi:carbamoyltransferase
MNILGLSFFYHDSAAALLMDGQLVATAEEERFSRRKHDARYPGLAIDFCLRKGGISVKDLDYVVFYEKPFRKFDRILMTTLGSFPRSWRVFRESMVAWLSEKLWVKELMQKRLGLPGKKILFADHHMSHASSAFYCSPFQKAAIMTVDGAGEWTTGTMGVGDGSTITLDKELRFPHSIGLLYSAFTAYCGFEVNEGEYKLMGLAPYGQPRYLDKIHEMVKVEGDGSIWLDMDYFSFHYSPTSTISPKFSEHFGRPPCGLGQMEQQGGKLDQFYADVGASIQKFTEDVLLKMTNALHQRTGLDKLCMAGGVALNSVANAKIQAQTPFKQIYVQPAAGDGGGALGAALWAYHGLLGNPRKFVMDHAFWGEEYGDGAIADFLRGHGVPYDELKDDDKTVDATVEALTSGKVIGWYQGRFEFGPRALGNRSILADPRRAEMKDIVNAKIKFREAFRPFAPSVLGERASEYFELENAHEHLPARFMLYVVPVKPSKQQVIPAITHVDGTGRLQTVDRATNPRYHQLISRFSQRTGVPVLLNTSFNLKGEPIVTTPENAFNTFMRSEMDMLVLNRFVVHKDRAKTAGVQATALATGPKDRVHQSIHQ